MGKPSPPTPPDPAKTIPEQTTSNINTAVAQAGLNAVDQSSPYGTVKYEKIGSENVGGNEVPHYQQNVTLSPEQQGLYNSLTGVEQSALNTAQTGFGNASQALSQPFSFGNVPGLKTSAGGGPIQGSLDTSGLPAIPGMNDFSADRQRVEDAYMSRFNQDFPKTQEDTISRLNAEGLQRGSAAYDTAMTGLDRQQNDARNIAIQQGGAEQSRLFGLASQARDQAFGERQAQGAFANTAQGQQYGQNYQDSVLQNQARQQGISEAQIQRNQPINELVALLGQGGNIQTPTGAPNFGVNVNPTDVLGAYGMQMQGNMNNYNQKMAANSALWDALIGGASKAGSAWITSDMRVKDIIRRIGETVKGIPLYLFTYKGSATPQVGVMAQEVREALPHAVREIGGILQVNYAEVQ